MTKYDIVEYTNYTNIDAQFFRAYEPGDRLVRGWQGRVSIPVGEDIVNGVERVWLRHNSDDRPDGQLCPSMSVGDVVVIGEVALSVDRVGFKVVQLDAVDLITDRSWSEVVRAIRGAV